MKNKLLFVFFFILLFSVIACTPPPIKQKPCPYVVRICPDGSKVGASGPDCSFAPCPTNSSSQDSNVDSVFEKNTGVQPPVLPS